MRGLAFPHDSHRHLVFADSAPSGGIFKLDVSKGTISKLVSNSTLASPLLPQIPHGLVSDGPDLVFTDRGKRQVCRLSDGKVSVICGTGELGRRNGAALESQFCEPTGICRTGNAFFVADRLGHSIRLISSTAGVCAILEPLNRMLKIFGVHRPGIKAEQHSLDDAISFLKGFHADLVQWTPANNIARGVKADAHADGADGAIPSKTVAALLLVIAALSSVMSLVNSVNPEYSKLIKLSTFLTLCVENFFAVMRARNPMPTLLEYAYLRIPSIKENAKLLAPLPFRNLSSHGRYYSLADGFLAFDCVPWPTKPDSTPLEEAKQLKMRDFTEQERAVRQRAPRAERSMEKTGSLPPRAWLSAAPLGERLNLAGVPLSSRFQARSWFALRLSAVPEASLPAGVTRFLLGRCNDGCRDDDDVTSVRLDVFASAFAQPLNFTFVSSRMIPRDAVFLPLSSADVAPSGCAHGTDCQLPAEVRDAVDKLLNDGDDSGSESEISVSRSAKARRKRADESDGSVSEDDSNDGKRRKAKRKRGKRVAKSGWMSAARPASEKRNKQAGSSSKKPASGSKKSGTGSNKPSSASKKSGSDSRKSSVQSGSIGKDGGHLSPAVGSRKSTRAAAVAADVRMVAARLDRDTQKALVAAFNAQPRDGKDEKR